MTKTLYKYRSWTNELHKKVVTENQVYLSSPKDFNDPFDCRIPRNFHLLDDDTKKKAYVEMHIEKLKYEIIKRGETLEYRSSEYLKKLADLDEQQRQEEKITFSMQDVRFGILSLSETWNNILMWSHYGDYHKGICVGFNEQKLIETRFFGRGGPVNYQEGFPEIHPLNSDVMETAFAQSHNKALDWHYEKEYRLITVFPTDISDVHRIVKLPDNCFSEIILGIQFPEKDITSLKKIAANKNIPLYQAYKKPFAFEIDRKLIN